MTPRIVSLAGVVLLGCAARTPPPAPAASPPPAVSAAPNPASAAFPAGLAPCPVDAKEGEGCAAKPHTASAPAPGATEDVVWRVPVGPDDPVKGPPDALVTIVVFSDFECPFCKRGAETLRRLRETYPKDVRVVWKDLPLPMHAQAAPAAELARTAWAQKGDAGFWAAHDLLYAAQPDLGDASLQKITETLGLRWTDVRAAIRGARFGKILQADSDLSDRVDVRATPTAYVNGRKIAGAQPLDTFRAVVDRELERARARVEAGTPRTSVYGAIVANGHEVAPPVDTPADHPRD